MKNKLLVLFFVLATSVSYTNASEFKKYFFIKHAHTGDFDSYKYDNVYNLKFGFGAYSSESFRADVEIMISKINVEYSHSYLGQKDVKKYTEKFNGIFLNFYYDLAFFGENFKPYIFLGYGFSQYKDNCYGYCSGSGDDFNFGVGLSYKINNFVIDIGAASRPIRSSTDISLRHNF
ncbi:MAG: hypothetical protein LBH46_01370 [Rickettsiales bacterium]|jgi:hypothetical protein|nr:hypothetical protein [Rickettsiales bacterium]